MKLFAMLLLMLSAWGAYSQTGLTFCSVVDPSGYCVLNNTKFISSPDSATALIYMKVSSPNGFASNKVVYQITSVNAKGVEVPYKSFDQDIEGGWTSSWQSDKFPSPGRYKVRILNAQNAELCKNSFELRRDW